MKKRLRILLLMFLMIFAVTACGSKDSSTQKSTQTESKKKEMHIVKDMEGTEVEVPKDIKKVIITSWGQPFGIMLSLGEVDKVQGMCDVTRYPWIVHQFPQFKGKIKDYGSFEKVNIEEIASANPDIVFVPKAAPQATKKMRELGIPVYVTKVEDTNEYYEKELTAIAKLLNKEEQAKKIIDHNHEVKKLVADRVKDIPEKDRKTFYIMRKTILEKHNNDWSSGQSGELAGGINVARNTDKGFNTTYEELMKWDPEYIFQIIQVEDNKNYYEKLKKDDRYSDIKAIKSGNTYTFPIGLNYWYEGADSALGVFMMGKIMYPDKFKDINIKKEAFKFYKDYLGIELNDESYDVMLRGFNGAKSMKDL